MNKYWRDKFEPVAFTRDPLIINVDRDPNITINTRRVAGPLGTHVPGFMNKKFISKFCRQTIGNHFDV